MRAHYDLLMRAEQACTVQCSQSLKSTGMHFFTNTSDTVAGRSVTKRYCPPKILRQQHVVFPSGHPCPRPTLLGFDDRTRTGILNVVWPLASNNPHKHNSFDISPYFSSDPDTLIHTTVLCCQTIMYYDCVLQNNSRNSYHAIVITHVNYPIPQLRMCLLYQYNKSFLLQ